MTRASYDPDSLLVGIIGKPHGLGGEVTLRAYNTHGADLARVSHVILETESARQPRALRGARRTADGWLLRLEGVDSRDAAANLVHVAVRVAKHLLPPLGAGEFFVEDLLGCLVQNEAGTSLGVVDSVFWNGAQDVMSIVSSGVAGSDGAERAGSQSGSPSDSGGGPQEVLIPVVPAFVRTVDALGRRVIVAWGEHD